MDPLTEFKENQKQTWSTFASIEAFTSAAAPSLVRHAQIRAGARLLDVACGTGVVALTAARQGASVTGADLTPALVARARESAALMGIEASWHEADVEALPFGDAEFDYVVSQFGHMFAPRPAVALAEMLRVLKPGGTIAFSTWPPELFVGRTFLLMGRYAPKPPEGVAPPPQWGDPNIVRERLGDKVKDISFSYDTMWMPTLSPQHYREFFEKSFGPANRLLTALDASDKAKADRLRREYEAIVAEYFADNRVKQDFLLTRAVKA